MNWSLQDWIKNLITLISIVAAILAWIAKLRWSKEYSGAKEAVINAKDEQIKTKQSQIEFLERQIITLQEQTPQKLREHYKSIQEQLLELVEKLEKELLETKNKVTLQEKELDEVTEREENLKVDILKKEEQIKKVRSEIAYANMLKISADRLVLSSGSRVGHAFIEGVEKNDNITDEEIDVDDEDHFTPLPVEPTIDNMVEWFLENYKNPADGVPYDGEYIYVYGGPYYADEVLAENFPDANLDDIENAVKKIEDGEGLDWVKRWQY